MRSPIRVSRWRYVVNLSCARRAVPLPIASVAVALLVGLSPRVMRAGVGEWTGNGPEGAYVHAIAANSAAPSIVYAATDQRLYRSVDAGRHWAPTTLSGIFDLILPTSAPSVVYATRLYEIQGPFTRSENAGESWIPAMPPPGRLFTVTVDPREPLTLYAVTTDGLFRTTNGAAGWDKVSSSAAPWDAWESRGGGVGIAVDPGDSQVLYAAFTETLKGVYRSTDRGATWTPTNLDGPASGLLFDPDGSRLFAFTNNGLKVTTDRGASWRGLGQGLIVVNVAIDPTDSRLMYVVTGGGLLFYSSNGGETLTAVVNYRLGSALKIASVGSSVALVGSERGIFRTEDAGHGWTEASTGIREVIPSSLAVDPTDPAVVFASNWNGVYESRDGGASWSGIMPGSPSANVIAFDPSSHSTLYAGGSGVQQSSDGGQTWRDRSPRDNGAIVNYIADLLFDPNDARRVFASATSVYRSVDGTGSWQKVMTPDDEYSYGYYYPGPPTVEAVAIAPSDSATLYAGGWQAGGFLYRSTDGGDTWTDLKNRFEVFSLEVDSCDPGILHAASSLGLFRTLDGGASWSKARIPIRSNPYDFLFVHTLARDPRHSSSLFAGTSEGLFWSNDRGATWSRFEPALDETVVSIALDPSGRFLYAGTQQGVFTLERNFDPCRDGPDRLCLLGAKFELTLTARDPRTGSFVKGRAIAEGDRFGYFSFPEITGNPGFPEVLVKMADARGAPPPYGGSAWVFHSSLTDLDYTLTVRETETGRVRTYSAADSAPLTCGAVDTSAFVRECRAEESSIPASGTRLAAGSGAELSLLGGRFRATIRATDPRTGRIAEGAPIPRADDFGYFSLPGFTGDPSFPEVFVKMVDGRAQPGNAFWVFHTGLTDVEYTLTVTDTTTGSVKTYRRGAIEGTQLCGLVDTTAFRDP
jgi:photosystem II stability/assembly factor-like uncharacterized protein